MKEEIGLTSCAAPSLFGLYSRKSGLGDECDRTLSIE